MTNEELFKVLRPIIMRVTGVPECILADGNIASPKGPYAAVRPRQSIQERGQANIYDTNLPANMVQSNVRAQVICTASVNFYRGAAQEYAERLHQCNKRPDVSIDLFKAKLGWLGTGSVNNLSALQSNNVEQRAQIDIRLLYEVENIAEINNILFAEVAAHYETTPEPIRTFVVE